MDKARKKGSRTLIHIMKVSKKTMKNASVTYNTSKHENVDLELAKASMDFETSSLEP